MGSSIANDEFESYFAEKLWEWIPQIYRVEDGAGDNPGVLRALIDTVAKQAATSRRQIDRIWDDEYIAYCDDWAIPYLGQLVQTRLVSALNRRGRRVDVAKTIFYRRRKGTPLVLETLIKDISGWEGALVEGFRRMVRARHGLDPEVHTLLGPLTGTAPGGLPGLRRAVGAELIGTTWDEFFHLFDPRPLRGVDGRYNISKANFHVFRLNAYEVVASTPFGFSDQQFTFDPSGRDTPLFQPDARPSEPWQPASEGQITSAIRCRFLGQATFKITQLVLDAVGTPSADALRPYLGQCLEGEIDLRRLLGALEAQSGAPLLSELTAIAEAGMESSSGKAILIPNAVGIVPLTGPLSSVPPELVVAANLENWFNCEYVPVDPGTQVAIDPERGRFFLYPAAPPATSVELFVYHYGSPGPVGAGTYERGLTTVPPDEQVSGGVPLVIPVSGVVEIEDSKTYSVAQTGVTVTGSLTLRSTNQQRPYVVADNGSEAFIFTGGASESTLSLEGLWWGQAAVAPSALVLEGDWASVTLLNCSVDPGGVRADGNLIPDVRIEVRGSVEELRIESSMVGRVTVAGTGQVQSLVTVDSIIDGAADPGSPAISLGLTEATFTRSTVFGDAEVNRMFASELLAAGEIRVTDNQHGCFRFSVAGPQSLHPPMFESHLLSLPSQFFSSTVFGSPSYAVLSALMPGEVQTGAENGSEMGAWSSLVNPIRQEGLAAKVREFQPVAILPQYIREN